MSHQSCKSNLCDYEMSSFEIGQRNGGHLSNTLYSLIPSSPYACEFEYAHDVMLVCGATGFRRCPNAQIYIGYRGTPEQNLSINTRTSVTQTASSIHLHLLHIPIPILTMLFKSALFTATAAALVAASPVDEVEGQTVCIFACQLALASN
jgi:hypothetical protein